MYKKVKAFTLIELLVVIAIVGILAGFIFVSMSGAVTSAKDAKRKADLANIEKGLLAYYAQNSAYPSNDTSYPCTIGTGGTCNNLSANLSSYLATLPIGPDGDRYTYNYSSGNFTLSGTLSTGPWAYNSQTGSWGSGYSLGQYKMQITVPAAAGASANYPIKLIINSSNIGTTPLSHMASDFRDLRFTDSSGTAQIPYWIESYTASTTATVWVQVPSISSGATIYMYYGTQATAASNGASTFTNLFDHFTNPTTSLNTSNWTTSGTAVSVAVNNSIATLSAGSGTAFLQSIPTFGTNVALRLFTKPSNVGNSGNYILYGFPNGGSYHYIAGSSPYYNVLSNQSGGTNNVSVSQLSTFAYQITELQRLSDRSRLSINDGAPVQNTSYYGTATSMFYFETTNGYSINVDWILVRPYVSTEPASSSLTYGSETAGQ